MAFSIAFSKAASESSGTVTSPASARRSNRIAASATTSFAMSKRWFTPPSPSRKQACAFAPWSAPVPSAPAQPTCSPAPPSPPSTAFQFCFCLAIFSRPAKSRPFCSNSNHPRRKTFPSTIASAPSRATGIASIVPSKSSLPFLKLSAFSLLQPRPARSLFLSRKTSKPKLSIFPMTFSRNEFGQFHVHAAIRIR